ncbi:trichohyalin-like protein 1 [Varanus komodoensis]|uniref:trichohyalin-like protein 1 n=1 Tax=Varanus komodoensis TaxID=61221 RepID=UPI001CF77E82|nr:trichohyalin-like protein 1 [Varanus komodoensis]
MPQLLDSICTIIGTFYKYAKWHEDCSTLNRKEMKKLIQKEFAIVLENQLDTKTAELIFQMLDINGDGMLDFNEYLLLLFNSAKACYRHLQSRECLLREEDGRGPSQEEGHRDPRERCQLDDDEREGNYFRGRPDSGRTRLRPIEGIAQGERRDCLPPSRERSSQAHDSERRDDRGRDHSFRDAEDEYEGRPRRSGTWADAEPHPQTRRWEPERDQAGRHQLRRREAAREEDRQRQSQELVPRSTGGRRHPAYGSPPGEGEERERYAPEGPERQEDRRHSWAPGTEHWLDEENLTRKRPSEPRVDEESRRRHPRAPEETRYDGGRCHPSSGSQEREDRRRRDSSDEQEMQDKLSSRDPERRQDRTHNHKPVDGADECFPLPRTVGGDGVSPMNLSPEKDLAEDPGDLMKMTREGSVSIRRRRLTGGDPGSLSLNPVTTGGLKDQNGRTVRGDINMMVLSPRKERATGEGPSYVTVTPGKGVEQRQTQTCHVDPKNDEQRRTPVHETVTREAEQRTEDVAPEDGEHQRQTPIYGNGQRGTERRGTQTGEPDPRACDHQRRTLVSDRRDGGQRQIQKPEDPKDGQQQEETLKSDAHARGIDQGRTQTEDIDPKCGEEQRLILPHDSATINADQRQNQSQDVGSRDSAQQRQIPSHGTDQKAAEKRQTQAFRAEPRTSGEQRQTPPPRGPDLREGDQSQTQVREVDPKGDDAQRLCKPHDAEQKGTKQVQGIPSDVTEGEPGRSRWTACDSGTKSNVWMGPGEPGSEAARACPDPTLSSMPQEGERSRVCPHGAVPMTSQPSRYQLHAPGATKGALGGQRPPEPAEAPQREGGQESSQLQKTKLEQAARRSHCLRGPELRRPERGRPQPQSTEPQEGEPRMQKAQEPGSSGSTPTATTQPHEAQSTRSQRGRPQVREARPEPRAEGKPGASQLPERGGIQDAPGGPEQLQPVVQRTSHDGGGGQPAPTPPQSEGDDESSQQARDPQPPLEEESQPGAAEGQSHPKSLESDASQGKPGDLCEAKTPVVCNPLYEYLVAQKKQEQL